MKRQNSTIHCSCSRQIKTQTHNKNTKTQECIIIYLPCDEYYDRQGSSFHHIAYHAYIRIRALGLNKGMQMLTYSVKLDRIRNLQKENLA